MSDTNFGGENLNREKARQLLGEFAFTTAQKQEAWEAWQEKPEGCERVALRALAVGKREGRSGAGLFLAMVRAGDHLLAPDPLAARPTGWRWVRGIDGQGGTYVEDPDGTDRLPASYDFATRSRVERDPREDLPRESLTPEVQAELDRLRGVA